jgi:hypothetical protein
MLGKFGRFLYVLRVLVPSLAYVLLHETGLLQVTAGLVICAALLGWYLRHHAMSNQQPILLRVTKVARTARSLQHTFFGIGLPLAIDLLKSQAGLPDPFAAFALLLVVLVYVQSADLPLDPLDYMMKLTHYDVCFANATDAAKIVTVLSRSEIRPADTVNLVYFTDNIAFNVSR